MKRWYRIARCFFFLLGGICWIRFGIIYYLHPDQVDWLFIDIALFFSGISLIRDAVYP